MADNLQIGFKLEQFTNVFPCFRDVVNDQDADIVGH